LHAAQTLQALRRGTAVFCQKPLGRCAVETEEAVDAAQARDLLLGVDFSYRFITGARKVHELCRRGELGELYAADLVFHNAYGPDKPWFYDPRQSGGGCVMDLGIHLVDLALWNLGFPKVESATARLWSRGKRLRDRRNEVEDYAEARLDLSNGASIRLACSWKLAAGCDAIISGSFYGTKGGAAFRNVGGSFYEFEAEQFHGTRRELLASGLEDWGARAAVDWVQRLAAGEGFDPSTRRLNDVARALDAIYQGAGIARPMEDFS
jgi:predicted dehydrogenase